MFKKKGNTITIHFEQPGKSAVTLKKITKGQNILDVLLHNHIEIKHDCGGVCACSSCHIYVDKGGEYLEDVFLREKHFIENANNPKPHSRLACQCLLTDDYGSVELTVPIQ